MMRLSKGDAWIEASVTRGNQGKLEAPVTHSTEVPTKLTVTKIQAHSLTFILAPMRSCAMFSFS